MDKIKKLYDFEVDNISYKVVAINYILNNGDSMAKKRKLVLKFDKNGFKYQIEKDIGEDIQVCMLELIVEAMRISFKLEEDEKYFEAIKDGLKKDL